MPEVWSLRMCHIAEEASLEEWRGVVMTYEQKQR
jgi:hypothetical protein